MATPVIMPMLGLTMEQGAVAEWLKREGDQVKKDEPLFTVEMDKGIVEVPAPASGVLRGISIAVGQTVPVKTVLAEIAAVGEVAAAAGAPPANANQNQIDEPLASPRPSKGEGRTEDSVKPLTFTAEERSAGRIVASPRARMRARELGVALANLAGTGPGGRIMEDDVLSASPTGRAPMLTPTSAVVVPPSRVRRITAERMAASSHSVARVTLFLEVDFTETARFRAQLAPEFVRLGVAKLPWDAIIAKSAALALAEHPPVNAQWMEGAGIRQPDGVHIGIAVALDPEGLVVPVLRNAHTRSLRELAADLLALTDKARANRLAAEDMQGGTFTITNLGAQGIDGFTPIINPPESAILGVGRIAEKPAVVEHQLQIREMCTLSLSFDHRVVDGAPAAAFLSRLGQLLERPYALLEI